MKNINKCSICNEDLKKYGNILLLDGILCRHCLARMSKWLNEEDLQKMSIDDVNKHLAYREENQKKLEYFHSDRQTKGKYSLHIDDTNKNFLISKRKDYCKDNADIIKAEEIDDMTIYLQPYQESDYINIIFCLFLCNEEIKKIEFVVNEFPGIEKEGEEFTKNMNLAYEYFNTLLSICADKEEN